MLSEEEVQSLVDKIVKHIEPEKVIVFGSYAKGTATAKSDLDFFVIKETHLPMGERDKDIRFVLTELLVSIDVHVYTPEEVDEFGQEEYSFVHSVIKTGKVLYEN